MTHELKTRVNDRGYKEFFDEEEGRWVLTHRRADENAHGCRLPADIHVHHINRDKTDNRATNWVALTPAVHARIHRVDPDACFNCGRSGHWDDECEETTDFNGDPR